MTWRVTALVSAIIAAWLVGSGQMTLVEVVITGVITGLIILFIGWVAKKCWTSLPRIIASADRKRGIVILIVLGCILTLALTYGLNLYIQLPVNPQPVNLQTTKPPEQATPPTLLGLFKSDFANVMKFTDEERIGIEWKDGSVLHIKTQVYADFPAKTQFVGFYIPASSKTYEACLDLSDAVESTMKSLQKRIAVSAGYRNERDRLQDLTFSGRVLLYHEEFLSIPQKAAIIEAYGAKHLDVQFRGPDYLGDQVIAWHRQHDVRKARE